MEAFKLLNLLVAQAVEETHLELSASRFTEMLDV